jgi:hypothetical protein
MFSLFSSSASNLPRTRAHASGFGLIELLVSISVITIVTAVILIRQDSFNGAVLLRSQAYQVALQVREVQLNTVSASFNETNFRSVAGLYFSDDSSDNQSYRVFRDADADFFYDVAEEFGQQGIMDSRFEVRDIRVTGDSYDDGGLSVVFQRPNFDALFYDGTNGHLNTASAVEIDIARVGTTGSGIDELRTVQITSAGQVWVQ